MPKTRPPSQVLSAAFLAIALGLAILAQFVPWGVVGLPPFAGAEIYSWGAKAEILGEPDSGSWFDAELDEETKSGAVMARLGFLGFLAAALFAGFALAASLTSHGRGTVVFGIGSLVVGSTSIILLTSGIKAILATGGMETGIRWSAGLILAWTSLVLILAGSMLREFADQIGIPQRKSDYRVGTKVGTPQGEGVIVAMDRHVYVLLEGRSDAWRFEPSEVHLIIQIPGLKDIHKPGTS